MSSKGISFAGFHVLLTANRRALALSWTVSNRLWRWIHQQVRRLLSGRFKAAPSSTRATIELQDASPSQIAILERVNQIEWYHSIDLGQGIVTPGMFDHRPFLNEYYLPERLQGKRVLDVATWDGFWAHEFASRGADVVAMDIPFRADIDLTPATRARLQGELSKEELAERTGKGFDLINEILENTIPRELLSVYDLGPDRVGMFDVVHVGDLLSHLKSPQLALENVLSVTQDCAIVSECFFPELDNLGGECLMEYLSGYRDCVWWKFSLESLRNMIIDAGFERVELKNTFRLGKRGERANLHHAVFWAYPPGSAALIH